MFVQAYKLLIIINYSQGYMEYQKNFTTDGKFTIANTFRWF
jgi:hypothetical protein